MKLNGEGWMVGLYVALHAFQNFHLCTFDVHLDQVSAWQGALRYQCVKALYLDQNVLTRRHRFFQIDARIFKGSLQHKRARPTAESEIDHLHIREAIELHVLQDAFLRLGDGLKDHYFALGSDGFGKQ